MNSVQNSEAKNRVIEFVTKDLDKIDAIIQEYPVNLPVAIVAEILNIDVSSARAATTSGVFGVAWRKPGKANSAYCIPTAKFVRWYLNMVVN